MVVKKRGVIIQARMGSTRLPGKVMLTLHGRPVLQHIIDRLRRCRNLDDIVLATTIQAKDDALAIFAQANHLLCFRGSEEDVLSRYYYAAEENHLEIVVRITSDCPFADPDIIDGMLLAFMQSEKLDYMSNTLQRTFPRGLDAEIFTFSALKLAFFSADKSYQREHVTPYIYEHPELFFLKNFSALEDNSAVRLVLDTKEDFDLIKRIYDELYPKDRNFGLNAVLSLLRNDSGLAYINAHVKQKDVHDNQDK